MIKKEEGNGFFDLCSPKENMKMKKRIYHYFVALLAMGGLGLYSCNDNGHDNALPILEVSNVAIDFGPHGGLDTIVIQSADAWVSESDADWLQISPATGRGVTKVVVRAFDSYSHDFRTGSIQINSQGSKATVGIRQMGHKKQMEASATQFFLPSRKSDLSQMFFDVEVLSNVPFSVDYDRVKDYWLTCKETTKDNKSAAPQKRSFRFYYDVYSVPTIDRTTIVFLKSDDQTVSPVEIHVSQEKAEVIEPSRAGDSLAVLAIARSLNAWKQIDATKVMDLWEEVTIENDRVVKLEIALFDTKYPLPFEIQYLTELRELSLMSNVNSGRKAIELNDYITHCTKLEVLKLYAYGISSLPNNLKELTKLHTLDLSSNSFLEVPVDQIKEIKSLRVFNLSSNRRRDGILDLSNNVIPNIGLGGPIPASVFELTQLEELHLGYNYFEGSIPESVSGMTNLKKLSLNLNRLTGIIPDWILYHPNLCDMLPYTFIAQQEGKDSAGRVCKFDNAEILLERCSN